MTLPERSDDGMPIVLSDDERSALIAAALFYEGECANPSGDWLRERLRHLKSALRKLQ